MAPRCVAAVQGPLNASPGVNLPCSESWSMCSWTVAATPPTASPNTHTHRWDSFASPHFFAFGLWKLCQDVCLSRNAKLCVLLHRGSLRLDLYCSVLHFLFSRTPQAFAFPLSETCNSGKSTLPEQTDPARAVADAVVPQKDENSCTWGGNSSHSGMLIHERLRSTSRRPRTGGAFVFQRPIISAELASAEPPVGLIKEECAGLAGNKLKGKRGGWRKWEGEEETGTEKLD